MRTNRTILRSALDGTILAAALLLSPNAFGHCDTMDGPVVQAANVALEKKDITPVLMWIKKDNEAQIQAAFTKTLAVCDTDTNHGDRAPEH
jgi:hypothetical protein